MMPPLPCMMSLFLPLLDYFMLCVNEQATDALFEKRQALLLTHEPAFRIILFLLCTIHTSGD